LYKVSYSRKPRQQDITGITRIFLESKALIFENTSMYRSDRMSIRGVTPTRSLEEKNKALSTKGFGAAVLTAAELQAALPTLGSPGWNSGWNAELIVNPCTLLEVLQRNSAKTPAPLRTERTAKEQLSDRIAPESHASKT
jgi:hypothetical protein